ncbi:MAG: Asp-tRNA(Asn)/Glu-tRNA(Gln) amidotransferase subunit GatB [Patescibacteria group bacterium]
MKYTPTIGLEIHAELKTKTKMFCNSKNDPDEEKPNVNICPVCMAHPGTLPVINKEAVKHVLTVGVALGGKLADFTEFDRKNYFYPDIPKGYQISQYKYPLVLGGSLAGVEITRIHLEEDTAKSAHHDNYSLIDFNRAGLPLMELVTEPVIGSAKQAGVFAKELQLLLRTLKVGEANMEKGEMRVEANISLREIADSRILDEDIRGNNRQELSVLGTKVEVKNLNSFRALEKAINYEINRQSKLLENGGTVAQETRGWDENKQETFPQRLKEGSADYRYFPDPDLPKLYISKIKEFSEKNLKSQLPKLPWEKREKYMKEYDIKEEDADMFVKDEFLAKLFDGVAEEFDGDTGLIKTASNYITSDIAGLMKIDDTNEKLHKNITAENFAQLMAMTHKNEISSRGAKDILREMYERGGVPSKIAQEKNLFQKSDEDELKKIIEKIISENQKVIYEYKNGKKTSLQFLIGQGMKETQGSANPEVLKKLFVEFLK